MDFFRTSRGEGFWYGLKDRPSTWLLAISIALLLLQWIPATGIWLMMFGGMLITGTLIGLFLISVSIEAIAGYLPRITLLLPLGMLSMYYGITVAQRFELAAMEATWAKDNRNALDFNPAVHTLTFVGRVQVNYANDPQLYAVDYQLPYVESRIGDGRTLRYTPSTTKDCLPPQRSSLAWTSRNPGEEILGRRPSYFCLLDSPPVATTPLVLSSDFQTTDWWGAKMWIETTTLSRRDEVLGTYKSGQTEIYPWLPMPIVGCGLAIGGGNGGWQCFFDYRREHVPLFANPIGYSDDLPGAVLLNLKRRSPEEIDSFRPPRRKL